MPTVYGRGMKHAHHVWTRHEAPSAMVSLRTTALKKAHTRTIVLLGDVTFHLSWHDSCVAASSDIREFAAEGLELA